MLRSLIYKQHFLLCWLLFAAAGCIDREGEGYEATAPSDAKNEEAMAVFPWTHDGARLAKIGPQACAQCHEKEVAEWEGSHHAKANRPVSVERDRDAFHPPREIKESGVTYRMEEADGNFSLKVIDAAGKETSYVLAGVIGETPIRQYLAVFPGNRLQTISASYDVTEDEWVDVFAGEDRMPGEWGHWAGQGMNWNANCAYCHTTEYQKNLNIAEDRYESTWVQQGLACAECHTGLETHMVAARSSDYTRKPALDPHQIDQNCATCHSRRDQLTADAFMPGDAYHDHFSLSLPDQPGLYYADGQIRDEVFVHASFEMSRMAHAGVTCMDCHNPHSLENTLPVQNNMLCMRCHENGHMDAPIIRPTEHSFHPAGSTGNRCVECHMPQTTYMQVDDRADHGFHSPDPLMTKKLGIPNACSSCHSDETVDWAIGHAEAWYGEALAESRQRRRAEAISGAYAFEPAAAPALVRLLADEEIPAWRATYAGLLGNYLPDRTVAAALRALLDDSSALVRERAVRALSRMEASGEILLDAFSDSSRSVRIAAARGATASGQPIKDQVAAREWRAYLRFNADRPQSLFILASQAAADGRVSNVQTYVNRAIELDRRNPQMYHQASILLSQAGLPEEARRLLFAGWELASADPVFPYSLGLLAAETGDLGTAIGYLEEAVALAPDFARAWYNLSLAYSQTNQPKKARRAMERARGTRGSVNQ
jgi:tetratricopeptide (TPR) repeat protein